MAQIYYIGGSPCSGKSTIAEMLEKKYNLHYYKIDDYLQDYLEKGAKDNNPWLKKMNSVSMDEMWLKEPELLNEEELATYENMFEYILQEIKGLDSDGKDIITEGAALMPKLAHKIGIDKKHYVCIVPTKEFQIKHYSQRPWIQQILFNYSDKQKAFQNWMDRDAFFALSILEQAKKVGYESYIVDGSKDISDTFEFVEKVFGL